MSPRPQRWTVAAVVLLTAVVLPIVPGLSSDSVRSLLTQMAIAAVFALSFNMLLGQTGLLSFGHAVYFGLGAYAAIHAMRAINQGMLLPMPLVPLAGAAAGLLGAAVLGSVSTRRAGTIFALISLGMGELVHALTFVLPSVFGGEEGITASRTRAAVDAWVPLGPQLGVYYVVLFWTMISAALMYAFSRTPVGRMCNAVRDNAERAEFVGYDARRVRWIAFCAAGLFAGLAGGLHALNYEIVAADAVGAHRSGTVLIMAYIGGVSHFAGPVLGAAVITWLQSSLSAYTSAWMLYVGLFFIVMIVFAPEGLVGLLLRRERLRAPDGARAGTEILRLLLAPCLLAVGAIVLIEMSYRLSTQPELGTRMRVLWMPLDAASAWPWALSVAAVAAGAALWRAQRSGAGWRLPVRAGRAA